MRNFAQRGKEKPWGIVTKSCVWRYPGPPRSLRNFWWSVKGFGRGKGSNFPFPHWLASSPLQNSRTTVRVCDQKGRNGHGNRNTCENGVCTMQGSRQLQFAQMRRTYGLWVAQLRSTQGHSRASPGLKLWGGQEAEPLEEFWRRSRQRGLEDPSSMGQAPWSRKRVRFNGAHPLAPPWPTASLPRKKLTGSAWISVDPEPSNQV